MLRGYYYWWINSFLLLLSLNHLRFAAAQEPCYPAGGVAGIVIATFVVTVVLVGLSLAAAWRLWKRKKGPKQDSKENHVTTNKVPGDFAFDNPYFREQEDDDTDGKGRLGGNRGPLRSSKQSDLSNKGKKNRGGKNHFIFGGGGGFRKQRALDDSCLAVEPERTVVSLRGHDFTGLGFNICGNMRDGILVKDVLHRGPASESGRIKAGDRIMSVTVSFANIVYEDALTILSYASPYDVQLELERIPEKSRTLQQSPSGSKRLGSCSFSGGGQKLFHPLYRSQSIDDLTQIDKDTFPSHGLGPRRSQSVGVAAHKLTSHFKNSDTMLEDRNRSSASVILSTTGSLNEKMLANVMVEGGLQKTGFQWEKRFEDTLDSESSETNRTSGLGDSKRDTPALTSKSQSLVKESLSSAESDRSDSSDEIPSPHHYVREKHKYHGPSLSVQKVQEEQSSAANRSQKNASIKTTAQIHRIEGRGSRKAKEIPESVNGMWHLEQCIREGHSAVSVSDIDMTHSQSGYANKTPYRSTRENLYPSSSSSEIHRESNTAKGARSSRHGKDEDSDVSHDSLELGGRKGRNKKTKRRSSSLGDVTQLEEAVNDATAAQGNKYHNAPQKFTPNDYKIQDPYQKAANSDFNSETNELSKLNYNNNNNVQKRDMNCNSNSGPDPNAASQYSNSEQKIMRTSNNHEHSPNIYMKSSKPSSNNPLTLYKESNATNVQMQGLTNRVNTQLKPSSNRNINVARNGSPKEAKKVIEKYYSEEKYEINSSRNFAQNYGSNDRVVATASNSNSQLNKAAFQQRPSPVNQQRQLVSSNSPDDMEHKRVEVVQEVPSSTQQHFIRKAASPAGMFTQISPFHQPSRHKNNANFKSWTNKEEARKDISSPANGNVTFHPHGLSKPVTTCDSSSHQRQKRDIVSELSPFAHRTVDGDMSKTVIVSTFDNNAGRSSVHKTDDGRPHPGNLRQSRK